MAKLTREQLNKWNAQAKNGFELDWQYYIMWGEKQLIKDIPQSDGSYFQVTLYYTAEFNTVTNGYGCKWNEKTGRHIPSIRINHHIPLSTPGMYQVCGTMKGIAKGTPEDKKKYSTLCKLSGKIDVSAELAEAFENGVL